MNIGPGSTPGAAGSVLTLSGGTMSFNLGDPPGTGGLGTGLAAQVYNMPNGGGSNEQGFFGSYASLLYRFSTLAVGPSALTNANNNTQLDFAGPAGNRYGGQIPMLAPLGFGNLGWNGDNQNYDVLHERPHLLAGRHLPIRHHQR